MIAPSFLMAASSLFAISFGAPVPRALTASPRSLEVRDVSYTVYGGDGTLATGWPKESEWPSFEEAWAIQKDTIRCLDEWGVQGNDPTETEAIYDGILEASKSTGVKPEYILAIMLQESRGCVRVPTTNYGVRNPGLMQSHNGAATCNEGGNVQIPCPRETIIAMIKQGAGDGTDFGLKHTIAQAGTSDVSKYYKGARIYNSGSIDVSGNLGAGIATHCYASDIANRLRGWKGANSACSEATIGSQTGSTGNTGNEETETPDETEDPPVRDDEPEVPETPNTPSTGPHAPGAVSNCKKWHTIQSGETCEALTASSGVSFAKLREYNTQLDSNCSNLWLGYAYCTGV